MDFVGGPLYSLGYVSHMDEENNHAERLELEPDLPPGQEPAEGELKRRTIKYTPAQQGTNIPAGWKPTVQKPIPVQRCAFRFRENHERAGEQCGKWSLRGSRMCYTHGGRGNLKAPEEYRKAIIEVARLELTESVPAAVGGLIDLSENATAENVRLRAITEILDRAGIKTPDELNVALEVAQADPTATLSERLDKLRRAREATDRLEATAALPAAVETGLEESADTPEVYVITDAGDDPSD